MRRTLVAITAILASTTLALTACGGGDSTSNGEPTIVTSTDVWGSVASAIAGDHAAVTTLFNTPGADPHEFEPSPSDTAKVADAGIVLLNGGHYDQYLESAPKADDATVINAFEQLPESVRAVKEGEVNEHVFYNLTVVRTVAGKLAEALAAKDAKNAGAYRANAQKFNSSIDGLTAKLAAIKKSRGGTKVAQTEPLATYLLTDAGLVDAAPAGFTAAVEEGQSPSAADRATFEDLLTRHEVHALLYNTQAVDSVTEAILATAQKTNVPVVKLTETLPDGTTDYVAWQTAQIDAIAKAVGA
ncbi:putative ABC transporter substrate binding protein [Gordonia effusa NBRC 100432]|uniref:Putative ABC transporter substrate binding protein n=1 Tax=Gordonia effusa NBRC 100432 TaxID=1077974 RepID=H0QYE8_9ACTN|nr:zinc ABC transporter substrate-binding protein [Gordonia effusa]GAB17849.1 putative ABC transporter substrate binding protein [Gordonia effusa NBRC 100432]